MEIPPCGLLVGPCDELECLRGDSVTTMRNLTRRLAHGRCWHRYAERELPPVPDGYCPVDMKEFGGFADSREWESTKPNVEP